MRPSRLYHAEAIILKRKNIGEADRILTIFTKEHGKFRVIAKGIRKITSRRAPQVEIFSHVVLFLHQGKLFDTVTDVRSINPHTNMRTNLRFISVGYYICELIDALLPEKQEHRDVFLLLTRALCELDRAIETHEDQFATSLLRVLGFLRHDRELSTSQIQPYVENIIERRVRSHTFLTRLKD